MSGPKSIVSGGTGLVGRFIVEALLEAGHKVFVMGRKAPAEGFFSKPVAFLPCTLEPSLVKSAVFEGADFFIHAAFAHEPGKYRGGEGDDPQRFRRLNLDGSAALFGAARMAGVKRVVFLSTRAVYGPRPGGVMLDETDACRPDTLYGDVKLAAESVLHELSDDGFAGINLRVTGVYGPAGPGAAHKWTTLFEAFLEGHPVAPRVATEVHGRDVAAAVMLMLEAPMQAVSGQTFNVSDLLLDRHDLLALVVREAGLDLPLPAYADAAKVNIMSTHRLRALGWRPGGRSLLEGTIRSLLS